MKAFAGLSNSFRMVEIPEWLGRLVLRLLENTRASVSEQPKQFQDECMYKDLARVALSTREFAAVALNSKPCTQMIAQLLHYLLSLSLCR